MLMIEEFRVINGCPKYEVSNLGRVRNIKTGKFIKSHPNKGGYPTVILQGNGVMIHRAVALAFLPNSQNKRCVNHINGIKTDNRVENLEWATDSENQKHAFKNGLNHSARKKPCRCVETGEVFDSLWSAASFCGGFVSNISQSINKGYRCKDYHFESVDRV